MGRNETEEAIADNRAGRVTRVGCPWQDLPEVFGSWNSIYKRFNALSLSNKWLSIFKALSIDPDCEWKFINGSYIKAMSALNVEKSFLSNELEHQ